MPCCTQAKHEGVISAGAEAQQARAAAAEVQAELRTAAQQLEEAKGRLAQGAAQQEELVAAKGALQVRWGLVCSHAPGLLAPILLSCGDFRIRFLCMSYVHILTGNMHAQPMAVRQLPGQLCGGCQGLAANPAAQF